MDFALTDDQAALVDLSARLFSRESTFERVRAAEAIGHDAALWHHIADTGLASVAVPEGPGGGLLAAALVVEQAGRHLASVPLPESMVATRIVPDESVPTFCPRPTVAGVARLVPGATMARAVVALDGDDLVAVRGEPVAPIDAPLLGGCGVADRPLDGGRTVVASGAAARERFVVAVHEWRALVAIHLVGAAGAALDMVVSYVSERRQFGAPIGSFQAVGHRLADVATDLEAARLVALEAAWCADNEPRSLGLASTTAYALAAEAAQRAVAEALHLHGGYGFMLEYDVQLFYRRVKAWTLGAGDADHAFATIGAGA